MEAAKPNDESTDDGGLLAPLTEAQQLFVETIGEVFQHDAGTWPVYDHIEATLDEHGIDALETFLSFPVVQLPGGAYSAIKSYGGPLNWPRPDEQVGLTVVGIHHCKALRRSNFPKNRSIGEIDLVEAFLALVRASAWRRQNVRSSPTTPRVLEIRMDQVFDALQPHYRFDQLPINLLFDLTQREPPYWGAGFSQTAEGAWTLGLPRRLREYRDVTDIGDYVRRLMVDRPLPVLQPVEAPSPLALASALDYLDTVWQLTHKGDHLFRLDSAERMTKLAYPAHTTEEFDSRVSGLGDVLRSSIDNVPAPKKKQREKPLGRLEEHLVELLGAESAPRIERNVATLEHVLFVRDAGQHGAAGQRGALALTELGIGFPIVDRTRAWETIKAETIGALDALREELQASARWDRPDT